METPPITYKPLLLQFRLDEMDCQTIARQGLIILVARTKPSYSRFLYEVIRVKQRKAGVTFGKPTEAQEEIPSAEDWGRSAWSLGYDWKLAWERFEEKVKHFQQEHELRWVIPNVGDWETKKPTK